METQTKTSAKDFFINLGAIVALYTTVVYLLNLLFTVINNAFPKITPNYSYLGSQSISFPVATLIIFFPVYVLLMWLLEKGYVSEPEKKNLGIRRWLTYITLFVSGLTLAIDLVIVLYYFIDGQDLTTGFLLKIFSVFAVTIVVFLYYISDIRNKLTSLYRKIWLGISLVVILGSVIWGFSVLGSPHTQQLLKYDQQKVSDLQGINNQVQNYYQTNGEIPGSISDLSSANNYYSAPLDPQNKTPYEYNLIGQSAKAYSLCAVFNKDSTAQKGGITYPAYGNGTTWNHPAGHYCFTETIPLSQYKNVPAIPAR